MNPILTLKDEMFLASHPDLASSYLALREKGQSEGMASILCDGTPPATNSGSDRLRNNTTEMGTLSRWGGKNDKFIPKSKAEIEARIELGKRTGKIDGNSKRNDDEQMADPSKKPIDDLFSPEKVDKAIQKGLSKLNG